MIWFLKKNLIFGILSAMIGRATTAEQNAFRKLFKLPNTECAIVELAKLRWTIDDSFLWSAWSGQWAILIDKRAGYPHLKF